MSKRNLHDLVKDRIFILGVTVVASLVAVLLLPSQSAASYFSYLLAVVVLMTGHQWRDIFSVGLFQASVALVLWLCISTLWSEFDELRDAVSIWINAVLVISFVVAAAECQMRGQVQRWIGPAFAIAGALAATAAIANYFIMSPEDGRLQGLGQLSSHVVAALVFGGMLVVLLHRFFLSHHTPLRLLLVLAATTLAAAVLLTASRNGWFAASFGILILIFAHLFNVREFRVSLMSACTISLLFTWIVLETPILRAFFLPRGDSFRLTIWPEFFDTISQSPIVGLGIATSTSFVEVDGITFDHAHSMYISILYQGGIVALLLFFAVIVRTLVVFLRNYDLADAKLGLALFGVALAGFLWDGHELIDKVGATWILFWFPVAIAIDIEWRNHQRT